MAYTRKVQKPDIRSLNIKDVPQKAEATPESPQTAIRDTAVLTHNPAQELKRIAACFIPLILLLLIAAYWDRTHGWVVPLAGHFLKL